MTKILFCFTFIFLLGTWGVQGHLHAQSASRPVTINTEARAYSMTERSDWRRHDNGRYIGLVNHEVRATIIPLEAGSVSPESSGSQFFSGTFIVMQDTLRDTRRVARPVDAVIHTYYEITDEGEFIVEHDRGFPTLRGFPAIPQVPVYIGYTWTAPGERAHDPLNIGVPLIVPFTASYEYRGTEMYNGEEVHRIQASYASRYVEEFPGEHYVTRIQGGHRVDVLVRVSDGIAVLIRDNLDILYTLDDGNTVQFRGFNLIFGQGIVPLNRREVITSIGNTLTVQEVPLPDDIPTPEITSFILDHSSIDIEQVPEGIRLSIRDIRFAPDSAEFLPEERYRLDLIAEALLQIPGRTFLVEGHTASVGLPGGEMQLSIERAMRMIDELVRRGLDAERFIYQGCGGTRPIADNNSEEGRSRNRRVEITILE